MWIIASLLFVNLKKDEMIIILHYISCWKARVTTYYKIHTVVAISLVEQIMCIYWGWQNILIIRESTVHWTLWQSVISNSEISSVLWLHELDRRATTSGNRVNNSCRLFFCFDARSRCANTERYHGYISSFLRVRGQTSLCFWILAKHWYFIDKLRLFFKFSRLYFSEFLNSIAIDLMT